MQLLKNKPLIALVGAVGLPMLALIYLASLPRGGRGSITLVLVQVGLVLGSVVLFGMFLGKFLDQVRGGRVRRWLATEEGRQWLDALSDEERVTFLARLDGSAVENGEDHEPEGEEAEGDSAVDGRGESR